MKFSIFSNRWRHSTEKTITLAGRDFCVTSVVVSPKGKIITLSALDAKKKKPTKGRRIRCNAILCCGVVPIFTIAILLSGALSGGNTDGKCIVAYERVPVIEQKAAEMKESESVRYALTEEERSIVEHTVMCEAGGESVDGMMLVAQCILNAAEHDGISPSEAIERYQYADYPVQVSTKVCEAVSDVFDRGNTVTDEPIMFFYSPANMEDGVSEWHETLDYVLTEGGHRFFALPEVAS